MDTKTALRHEYRKTWETFSRHTSVVHNLAGAIETKDTDKAALEAAMRKADVALAAHQEARNRLVAAMVPAVTGMKSPAERAPWSACSGRAALMGAEA